MSSADAGEFASASDFVGDGEQRISLFLFFFDGA